MRLRSNAPFEPTSLNPRIEIATYTDGRSIGYDPRTTTGFDVAGMCVSLNDIIAYDRLGSLCWESDDWRSWVYEQVGLAVPDGDELAPSPTLETRTQVPYAADDSRLPGLSMLVVAAVLVTGCLGAFFLGTLVTSPPPNAPTGRLVGESAIPRSLTATGGIHREASDFAPAYVVVSSSVESGIGRVGNVLVASADAGTSAERHRDICRAVALREKFSAVRLFRSADAYVAMRDARFRAENPEALAFGFLGIMVDDGTFIPAEELHGSTAIPSRK